MLTHHEIEHQRAQKNITISPFNPEALGPNSYDVHLSDALLVYSGYELDCKKPNDTQKITIPDEGIMLHPGRLYLGSTIEYTESIGLVPGIEGKSSLGRLGVFVHVTAGFGDIGFKGHWTLEFTVIHPVRIYKGMPIAQLYYFLPTGQIQEATTYDTRPTSKYASQGKAPEASKMHLNFKK